jgi:hypothetical protein
MCIKAIKAIKAIKGAFCACVQVWHRHRDDQRGLDVAASDGTVEDEQGRGATGQGFASFRVSWH